MERERVQRLLIALCVAIALAVALGFRLHALFHAPLWGDEGFSVILARAPLGVLLARPIVEHPHPPLYYLLLKVLSGPFGLSEATARGASVAFGIGTVLLVIAAGRALGATREGVLASFLVAWSFLDIYVSQLVRMYSMLGFLSLLAFIMLARALTARQASWWIWYGLCGVALVYTHYLGVVVVLSLALGGIAALAVGRRASGDGMAWWGLVMTHAAIGAAFLPWLPFALKHLGGLRSYMQIHEILRFGPGEAGRIWIVRTFIRLVSLFSFGERVPGRMAGGLIAALFFALSLWGLVRIMKRRPRAGMVLAVGTIVPVILLVLLSPKVPTQPPARYFALTLPGYLLLLAAGIGGAGIAVARRLGRWVGAGVIGLLLLASLGLGLPTLGQYYRSATHADYREVVRWIEEHPGSGKALVCLRAKEYALLDWYATEPLPEGWHLLGVDFPWASHALAPGLSFEVYASVVGTGDRFVAWADSVEQVVIANLDSLLEQSSSFLFLYALSVERKAQDMDSILDPRGGIRDWLEDRYWRREIFSGEMYSLILYEIRREE
jgi:4-amino-4-deoxy-L-arabinose transferase-like glycosyltransferase